VNIAESITKKIEVDASSYSVTVLHLGSEKMDGIDHSWARPLAREVIDFWSSCSPQHKRQQMAPRLFAMRPFPRSKTHFSVK